MNSQNGDTDICPNERSLPCEAKSLSALIWTVNWQPIEDIYASSAMATNVALTTTMGTIVVELYDKHAPKTCMNFKTLTSRGYYNNVIFHRIIPNFMVQSGDPTGSGREGESIYGPTFNDEISQSLKHTGAGILSMANSGPNTNGSQFFITLAPTPWLDGKHTIFGRVTKGIGVVRRLGLVRTDAHDRPVEEVKILEASVLDSEQAPDKVSSEGEISV